MSATFATAYDEILALFKAAWDTTAHSANVDYENVAFTIPAADGTNAWARPRVRHASGGDGSLAGGLGTKSYDRTGVLLVQVFTSAGAGLVEGHALAKIVADAFDGVRTASGVWFRNVRLAEVGPDGEWFQLNISVDFAYDEVK